MPLVDRAEVTVFCAVWSGDPDRWDLLEAHVANLRRQTRPVAAVYVFDDGDTPPDWVPGRRAVASRPLSIYQAWSVGTQLAESPLLMNLNLDDRLAEDAVEVMGDELLRTGAGLVGGDWRICFDQATTDAVGRSGPVEPLRVAAEWPPRPGARQRLGSGTGERGTYGPATMWRRELHDRYPYPWAFGTGEPIRVVGDLAWWLVLQQLGVELVRIPRVVGRYRSHPATQGEFRVQGEEGRLQAEGLALSPYALDDVRVEDAPA